MPLLDLRNSRDCLRTKNSCILTKLLLQRMQKLRNGVGEYKWTVRIWIYSLWTIANKSSPLLFFTQYIVCLYTRFVDVDFIFHIAPKERSNYVQGQIRSRWSIQAKESTWNRCRYRSPLKATAFCLLFRTVERGRIDIDGFSATLLQTTVLLLLLISAPSATSAWLQPIQFHGISA